MTVNKFRGDKLHPSESILFDEVGINYVPLDYIKAEIIGYENQILLDHSELIFTEPVDTVNGEIPELLSKDGRVKKRSRIAKYKNLLFRYYPHNDRMFFSGSLHTLSNDGKHNYNDFTLKAFKGVLNGLYNEFGVLPKNLFIYQLEYAVNLLPKFDVNLIIDHCISHKWKKFEHKYNSYEGKYIQAEHKRYYLIKIYNKGLQNGLNYDILRIERKQLDYAKYCHQQNIGRTLQDLIESGFKGLGETLILNWNEVLFFDPMMDKKQKKIFKYRDPIYWTENFNNRTTRRNHVTRLRKFNSLNGGNIQGEISNLMESKLIELQSPY